MARVGVRGDTGKLFFDFKWGGKRRREQTALDDTPPNRKRAEQVLRALCVDIERGQFEYLKYFPNSPVATNPQQNLNAPKADSSSPPRSDTPPPSRPQLRDFAETWYDENEVRWRRTTRGLMRMVVDKHLVPAFGDRDVSLITRADVLAFRVEFSKRAGRRKGETISPKSVNDTMGVLKAILDEAAARFGFVSPCLNIKRLKVQRTDVQPFTLDEAKLLIETIRKDYKVYLTVRMYTGMRTGEANGLKWGNVDFKRRQILVRETFTHGEQDACKTDASWREIEMSQPVHDALLAHCPENAKDDAYVFPNAVGEAMDNHNFTNRVWYPLLRLLNLKKRRPYQMRHTAATLWLAAGENPTWIARQLGHTSLEMLFRTYARWVKDMTRKDGSAFEKLLEASNASNATEEKAA